jgi:hypothetical protein
MKRTVDRREYLRLAKQKQRAKDRETGAIEIRVSLTASQAAVYRSARELQRGPVDDFSVRCLTIGAMFLANMGNPRGSKLTATVDASTSH